MELGATVAPMTDAVSSERSKQLAYFFIPLRQPLGVPDHWRLQVWLPPDWGGWESAIHKAGSISSAATPEPELTVSLLVHQLTETVDDDNWRLIAAARAAATAFPSTATSAPADWQGLSTERPVTVVEVATFLDPRDEFDIAISDAFDRGIEAIRVVQEAHQAVTTVPLELCTREDLAPMVPMALREVAEDETQPSWPEEIGLFLTSLPDAAAFRTDLSEDHLAELGERIAGLEEGRPFSAYSIHRNAARKADQRGLRSEAAIFAAVACEVLLGDVLALMIWEDLATPEDAITTIERPFATKLRTEYHLRLGGSWSSAGRGPVAALTQDVLALRHRVLHVGHVPSRTEVAASLQGAARLERFVGDRLAAGLRRYPITAIQFCGKMGLASRGALSRFALDLMDDPTEPPWVPTFMRWRQAVDWLIETEAGRGTTPNLERSATVCVLRPQLGPEWWRVDRRALAASPAIAPKLSENHARTVNALSKQVASRPEDGPVDLLTIDLEAEPVQPVTWVRVSKVLPLHFVMRDFSDLRGVPTPALLRTGEPARSAQAESPSMLQGERLATPTSGTV